MVLVRTPALDVAIHDRARVSAPHGDGGGAFDRRLARHALGEAADRAVAQHRAAVDDALDVGEPWWIDALAAVAAHQFAVRGDHAQAERERELARRRERERLAALLGGRLL